MLQVAEGEKEACTRVRARARARVCLFVCMRAPLSCVCMRCGRVCVCVVYDVFVCVCAYLRLCMLALVDVILILISESSSLSTCQIWTFTRLNLSPRVATFPFALFYSELLSPDRVPSHPRRGTSVPDAQTNTVIYVSESLRMLRVCGCRRRLVGDMIFNYLFQALLAF